MNRIDGVMVSMLTLNALYIVGSSPGRAKPKTIKLVFAPFPLSM
jgi:hypothetical protein